MKKLIYLLFLSAIMLTSCAEAFYSSVSFPSPDDVFITTGDGDIQKPYTPMGQMIYSKSGFRLPLPILGLLRIADVDPDRELKQAIFARVREMGGDALINMRIHYEPPSNGFLGLMASGGSVTVYGTVIKR